MIVARGSRLMLLMQVTVRHRITNPSEVLSTIQLSISFFFRLLEVSVFRFGTATACELAVNGRAFRHPVDMTFQVPLLSKQ